MKAKAKTTNQVETTIKSDKDAAYQFAVLRDAGKSIVAWVLNKHPDFAEKVSDETKAHFYDGFTVRFHENNGENVYIKGDTGALILVGNTAKSIAVNGKAMPKVETMPAGAVAYGIHQVQAYTPQQRGMLKTSDPALHSVLQPIATAFNKYASNALADMQKQAKAILDEKAGVVKTREMKLFLDSMTKQFDAWEKQVKNAEKRMDETASPVNFKVARDAFFKAYNAK